MSLIQKKIKFNNNKKLILGDPGAVSRVDKMFVVKVYCKIETSSNCPWVSEDVKSSTEVNYFDLPHVCWIGER